MTEEEAVKRFEKLTYDLAKCVGRLAEIKSGMDYVNDEMGWDGMFLVDFDEALAKLANVESGAIVYSMEDKHRENDIREMKQMLEAYGEE